MAWEHPGKATQGIKAPSLPQAFRFVILLPHVTPPSWCTYVWVRWLHFTFLYLFISVGRVFSIMVL